MLFVITYKIIKSLAQETLLLWTLDNISLLSLFCLWVSPLACNSCSSLIPSSFNPRGSVININCLSKKGISIKLKLGTIFAISCKIYPNSKCTFCWITKQYLCLSLYFEGQRRMKKYEMNWRKPYTLYGIAGYHLPE